jgi:hypothetical protein
MLTLLTVLTQKPALLSGDWDESYSDGGLVICGVFAQERSMRSSVAAAIITQAARG